MKRLLLLACTFVSFATISQAQISKGSILLGGTIGFSNAKNEDDINNGKSNTINFNPTVGIAIKENWVMGISAGFSSYKEDPSIHYSYKRDGESYSGGLFVRRYSAIGKNFYLYGNGAVTYNQVDQSQTNSASTHENYYHSKGITLSIAPGIAYAINKWFHLEASLNNLLTAGYTTSDQRNITLNNGVTSSSSIKSKSFGFGTNLNPTSSLCIGVRFVLGK